MCGSLCPLSHANRPSAQMSAIVSGEVAEVSWVLSVRQAEPSSADHQRAAALRRGRLGRGGRAKQWRGDESRQPPRPAVASGPVS